MSKSRSRTGACDDLSSRFTRRTGTSHCYLIQLFVLELIIQIVMETVLFWCLNNCILTSLSTKRFDLEWNDDFDDFSRSSWRRFRKRKNASAGLNWFEPKLVFSHATTQWFSCIPPNGWLSEEVCLYSEGSNGIHQSEASVTLLWRLDIGQNSGRSSNNEVGVVMRLRNMIAESRVAKMFGV